MTKLLFINHIFSKNTHRHRHRHVHLHTNICIVGGGIIGTALAVALGQSKNIYNTKITLIDSGNLLKEPILEDGVYANRVSSVTPSSERFLKELGAWDLIPESRKTRYNSMHIWEAIGNGQLTFSNDKDEPIAHILENRLIQSSLAKIAAKSENIEILETTKVNDLSTVNGRPVVNLESGESIECELLVGADGPNSKVREYAKIKTFGYKYNQNGLVGTILVDSLDRPFEAWQRFLPTGPIGLLPLSDTTMSFVWTLKGDLAFKISKLSPENFVILLNSALNNPAQDLEFFFSNIRSDGSVEIDMESEAAWGQSRIVSPKISPPLVVKVVPDSLQPFPLRLQHAGTYNAERVVLVGDAIHTVHPLAGQGLNLGLSDVKQLSKLISESIGDGQEIGDPTPLSRYSCDRYASNSAMLVACDFLSRLFGCESAGIAKLRSLGVNVINQSDMVKSILKKIAS